LILIHSSMISMKFKKCCTP